LNYQKRSLSDLPDDVLLDDREILDVISLLEEIRETGDFLIRQIDEHQRQINCTNGVDLDETSAERLPEPAPGAQST